MTSSTTSNIISFCEGLLDTLECEHRQCNPDVPFEQYLRELPMAWSPEIYWDEEAAILRSTLLGRFGDFEMFEFCNAFSLVFMARGMRIRLQGSISGSEGAEYCFE